MGWDVPFLDMFTEVCRGRSAILAVPPDDEVGHRKSIFPGVMLCVSMLPSPLTVKSFQKNFFFPSRERRFAIAFQPLSHTHTLTLGASGATPTLWL